MYIYIYISVLDRSYPWSVSFHTSSPHRSVDSRSAGAGIWHSSHKSEIRYIRFCIRIYLPVWPDKVMRDLHCWEWQQFSISALSSLSLTREHKNILRDTQVSFRVSPVFIPCTALLIGLMTMLKKHHILETQQCKTIMTLSDHKGKQISRDAIPKRFMRDFWTMFIIPSCLTGGTRCDKRRKALNLCT
jgi:hypothetical protein